MKRATKFLTDHKTSRVLKNILPEETLKQCNPPFVYAQSDCNKMELMPSIEIVHPQLYELMKEEGIDCNVETPAFDVVTLMELLPDFTLIKSGDEYIMHIDDQFDLKAVRGNELTKMLAQYVSTLYARGRRMGNVQEDKNKWWRRLKL